MNKINLKYLIKILYGFFLAIFFATSFAQDFPNRSIRIIVPYPPGGGADLAVRAIQKRMSDILGQPVLVENQAGGGTLIATKTTAMAKPDGYVLGMVDPAFLVNPVLNLSANYDVFRDFLPVSLVSVTPMILAIPSVLPVKNLPEFIQFIKANPSTANYGSPGMASAGHIAFEQMLAVLGLSMTHIPYKGSIPSTTAILSNEVSAMMSGSALIPMVQSGKLKAIAITGKKRLESLPNVPTFEELGYPQINVQTFVAIVAPTGTPKSVIDKLQYALIQSVNNHQAKITFDQYGQIAIGSSSDELAAFFRENQASLLKVVKDSSIKAN
jgi:tripartite-type tricarboxylate transporter receptor subunit TctC